MIKGFAMVLSAGLILGCVTGVVWMGGEAVQAGRGTDVVSQEEPGPGGAAEAADDSEVAAGQEISVSGAAVESQTAPEGLTNEKTKEKIERNEDGRLEFSVAGNEEALAGLPKEVLAQIEGINAGEPLRDVIDSVELEDCYALVATYNIVARDPESKEEKTGKDSLTLYIPNLLKGLSDVSALFYDKAEGEWRIIPAEKVDTDAKTVTVTLTGSGTMTVIYRRK